MSSFNCAQNRLSVLFSLLFISNVLIAGNFTWKTNAASSSWEDPANWTGGTVPVNGSNQVVFTSADNITIVSSINAPVLNSNQTIGIFTVSSGSVEINSVINVNGAITISNGTLVGGSGQINAGAVTQSGLTIGGTSSAGATINCSITGSFTSVNIRNNIFGSNATISLKVYNTSGYYSIGGNTFNGRTTFESAGNSGIRLSDLGEDKFNNDLTLIATAGLIYTSYNYNTTYNGNIIVKSTASGVYFGNPTGNSLISSTLASGKTITAQNFIAGALTLKNFKQQGSSTPQIITLGPVASIAFISGTGGSGFQTIFESPITVTSGVISTIGSNFKEAVEFYASQSSTSSTGNLYEKKVTISFNNSNVNNYWTHGSDQYLGDATFVNENVGVLYVGNGTATFGGNVTFDNKSSGSIVLGFSNVAVNNFTNPLAKAKFISRGTNGMIKMADNGITNFNCNVEVNSIASSSIYSVYSAGKVYLRDGRTISVGDLGFSAGNMIMKNFIQEGVTAQTLLLLCNSTTNALYIQAGCDFSGNLTVQSSQIILQGGTFRGVTDITMCYPSNLNIYSVNSEPIIFKGDTYIRNKGASHMWLGNGTPTVTFEGNSYFSITSTGQILLSSVTGSKTIFAGTDKKVVVDISSINNANAGSFYFGYLGSTEINSNVELSNNANANIVFGSSAAGTTTLSDGKFISIAQGAISFGGLYFRKFTQIGNTTQNIGLTGNSIVWLDPGAVFNGEFNVVSPRIILNGGGIFNGNCSFEKTGATFDQWNGGNEFNKKVTIKNSGPNYILTGYTGGGDHFYDEVVFWNTSSGGLYPAFNGTTQFDGNILCKNTGLSSIFFSNNTGTSVLAAGKTVSAENFISGTLSLRNFKQTDATTPQNIMLDPNGTATLTFAVGSEFWGDITAAAPNLGINGVFKGVCRFTRIGSGTSSASNSYFSKDVTFNNNNTGDFLIGGTDNTFEGNVALNNNSTGRILISNSTGQVTNFNGLGKIVKLNNVLGGSIYLGNSGICNVKSDLELSNLSTGGIYFASGGGQLNLSSSSHIAATSFNSGILSFRGTKQESGSPDFNLNLPNARLIFEAGNEFYSNINATCNNLNLNGSLFHGAVEFTLNNNLGGDAQANGGNTFESDFKLTSTGNNGIGLAAINRDIYKGNVILNKNGNGNIYASKTGISEYYKNLTFNVISPYVPSAFGSNGGTTVFKGSGPQVVSSNYGSLSFVGGGIKIEKESNNVTLNATIDVSGSVLFVKGNFIVPSPFYFSMSSNTQTVNGFSSQSFIEGLIRRYGNTAFTFPIGKGGKYMPISISAPSTNEDIRVEAFLAAPPNPASINNTLSRVSSCQYWNVQRVSGSSNVSLTIPWSSSNCEGINTRDVGIAQCKNNIWQFFGANNKTINGTDGSVTSNAPFTSGFYTLGYIPFNESIFGVLSSKLDGSLISIKGQKINFRFLEQYKDAGSLNYKIYSQPSEIKGSGVITTAYGQNYKSIELQTLGLVDGKLYILEVIDEKNRKSYLKFEYKNN